MLLHELRPLSEFPFRTRKRRHNFNYMSSRVMRVSVAPAPGHVLGWLLEFNSFPLQPFIHFVDIGNLKMDLHLIGLLRLCPGVRRRYESPARQLQAMRLRSLPGVATPLSQNDPYTNGKGSLG
jgi:hypothetical protein